MAAVAKVFALVSACLALTARAGEQEARMAIDRWQDGLKNHKVIYAVNCGGSEYTDDTGLQYLADRGFTGGQQEGGCGSHNWAHPHMVVYHSERWGE